jgi:hypothetical protein
VPILDAVDLEKSIEAAQLAVMRERLGAGDVIGRGAGFCGHGKDPFGRDSHGQAMRSIFGRSRVTQERGSVSLLPRIGNRCSAHPVIPCST